MEKHSNNRRLRLNLFDIVILIVILALGAVFVLWQMGWFTDGFREGETRTVRYTVELTGMKNGTAGEIQVGDTMTDTSLNAPMGTVVAVEVKPSTTLSKDLETGEYFETEIPEVETAIVTLEAECTESQELLTLSGGYVIRGGATVSLYGPGYFGEGYVLYVERGE